MTIPSAKRKTIQEHLCLIDAHLWPKEKVIHDKKNLWPFQARSAKPFMNIYGSLMLIYDPKKKVIHDKKNLWLIDDHFWPKKKVIHDKKNL